MPDTWLLHGYELEPIGRPKSLNIKPDASETCVFDLRLYLWLLAKVENKCI